MKDLMTSTYMTGKDIAELRRKCFSYGLDHADILDKYSDGEIAAMYNDFGPGEFPVWLEDVLYSANPYLGPACLIYDLEMIDSDGKRDTFVGCCRRLWENGRRIAKIRFHWWRPARYLVALEASVLARANMKNGWEPWVMYSKHKGEADARMSDVDFEIGYSSALYRACRFNLVYSIYGSPLVL